MDVILLLALVVFVGLTVFRLKNNNDIIVTFEARIAELEKKTKSIVADD